MRVKASPQVRKTGKRFGVVLVMLGAGVLHIGASERVTFTYEHPESVVVSVAAVGTPEPVIRFMVGAESERVTIPLEPGDYSLLIARVDDYGPATVQLISVAEGAAPVSIRRPPYSRTYQTETARSEFIAAAAVESTLSVQRITRGRTRWAALGVGVLAGAGAGTTYVLGQDAYQRYNDATTTAAASQARGEVTTMATLTTGLAIGAGVGLITGLIAQLSLPDITPARDRRVAARAALRELEANDE